MTDPVRPRLLPRPWCIALVWSAAALLSGCAATSHERDPFEPVNRSVWAFNERLDRSVLVPVARGYNRVVPAPARGALTNAFANLGTIESALAALLQGKFKAAGSETGRFLMNSTVGLLGFVDIASEIGLVAKNEDLGQTFAVWGLDGTPYLVLPVFGPSTVVDLPDLVLHRAFLSAAFYGFPLTANLTHGLTQRADALTATDARDQAALDAYTFTREAWLQRRRYLIYDGNPPLEDPLDDLDFDEMP